MSKGIGGSDEANSQLEYILRQKTGFNPIALLLLS